MGRRNEPSISLDQRKEPSSLLEKVVQAEHWQMAEGDHCEVDDREVDDREVDDREVDDREVDDREVDEVGLDGIHMVAASSKVWRHLFGVQVEYWQMAGAVHWKLEEVSCHDPRMVQAGELVLPKSLKVRQLLWVEAVEAGQVLWVEAVEAGQLLCLKALEAGHYILTRQ